MTLHLRAFPAHILPFDALAGPVLARSPAFVEQQIDNMLGALQRAMLPRGQAQMRLAAALIRRAAHWAQETADPLAVGREIEALVRLHFIAATTAAQDDVA